MTRRHYCLIVAALLLAIPAASFLFYWLAIRESTSSLLRRARVALSSGRYEQAEQLAGWILARNPLHDDGLFVAGTAASKRERFSEAVDYYDRVSDQYPEAADARFRAGELLILQLCQPAQAELRLRRALRLQPSHGQAQQHLSALLGLCGDTYEAVQLRLARVKSGDFADIDLLVLALGESVDDATVRERIIRASSNDSLTRLIQANEAIQNRDLVLADELLGRVIQDRSDLLVAKAKQGRVLLDQGNVRRLEVWLSDLSSDAERSPDIWLIRGEWARQQRDDAGAARCFAEALRLDPASQRANYQLSQVLHGLGKPAEAETYRERANLLHELNIAARACLQAETPATVQRMISTANRARLDWDAWGWQQISQAMPGGGPASRHIKRPEPDSPRIVGAERDLERIIREYRLPHVRPRNHPDSPVSSSTQAAAASTAKITFTDDAASAGLKFQYVPGDRPSELGLRMFQFSGGGVAVVDFDLDGWPDLYLPQGHLWPATQDDRAADASTRDRFYRNLGNGRFEDVTGPARFIGRGYGQGATIGDFNTDGFPDVYVATLRGNRLYRNEGDGTFMNVSAEAGISSNHWTTSCLMADLNADGLPDLYDVNYLEAPDLLDRICHNPDGRPRRCSPFELDAAPDQLFLNQGDGRFEDVSREAGILLPGGKGLGIVAADFDGSGRLSLFIANDMMPNFYFVNETASPGGRPRFAESALAAGVAYDRDGRAQGCMGIALGDAQRDGLLDMFVTNYYRESNTLYKQQGMHSFEDASQAAGLRDPSLEKLGFGTQFLDADLDGWLDLVAVNGHVDDETYRGIPFHMSPQFFRNSGDGTFTELNFSTPGPWFKGRYLGRGLARLDWNRDGREDFIATNLDSPAALLTNRTENSGHSIRLQLRGVQSSRDAIGTIVRTRSHGLERVQQLTAGDGYESSNQRQLVIGIGDAMSVELLTIRWPAGSEQEFKNVMAGVDYLALEGEMKLFELP